MPALPYTAIYRHAAPWCPGRGSPRLGRPAGCRMPPVPGAAAGTGDGVDGIAARRPAV